MLRVPPTGRRYRDEGDRALIHDLLREIAGPERSTEICTIADFEWWQVNAEDPESLRSVCLWFRHRQLVGFSWPGGDSLDLVTHPDHRDLEVEIINDWLAGKDSYSSTLSINALESDGARAATLEACGFAPVKRAYNVWEQALNESPPAAAPATGYTLRSFVGEVEVGSRVAAHRSAFEPSKMTVEKHRRAMASPLYRQNLDLVAVAQDGEVAAYALVWFDPVNRKGYFEPVGTHAGHRRRGLARCVILEGLRRLQALGATLAYVNSNADNVPSNALYAACGFQIAGGETRWERRADEAMTPPA